MRPVVEDFEARLDPGLEAVLGAVGPLSYADPSQLPPDCPPFVRSASAIRRWGNGVAVVQDDVNVLAVRDGEAEHFQPLILGPGADGHFRFEDALGNKRLKLDLEAATELPDGRLLLFGSGSSPLRQTLVLVTRPDTVHLVDGRDLYANMRREPSFAGSELNLEGALVVGDVLHLIQRGNGAPQLSLAPVNAIGALPLEALARWLDGIGPAPELTRIRRYELGRRGRARFGFTDVALHHDGSLAFIACAEDSPDATRDGEVLGCRFGVIDAGGVRWNDVVESGAALCRQKLEGIEADRHDPTLFEVVADPDDASRPALGALLRVTGY
jgi:hypothetical protein